MYILTIYTVGKIKEHWLLEGIHEYEKRLKPYLSIEWILAKQEEQLPLLLKKIPSYLCLDPLGKDFSSEEFSFFLHEALEKGGSRLHLVIGGPSGLIPEVKSKAAGLLSLSPLTFPHQLTRLILVEQVYRAIEIRKGTRYAR